VDGEFLADIPLANGSASYTFTGTLIPIQHTVTATYNGDSNYASRSFSVSHTVSPPTYATQTVLTAAPSTILASQTVRLSAVVTSAVSVPAGVVTFLDGSASIGSATIDSAATAHFDTALLAPGVHSLAATFQGFTENGFNGGTSSYVAAIFSPSTSAATTETVNAIATGATLTSSPTTVTAGAVVNFTAQVSSNSGVPYGGVSFYDGTVLLGTLPLNAGGNTTFSTASLVAGSHSITAAFNANGPFAGSISAPVSISVLAAAATARATLVSLAPEMNPPNSSSTLVATVSSPEGSPAGTVTFLDGGTILGTAVTDLSSNAVLRVGTLGSGIHNFTTSFSGGPEFSPSVSPALYNFWPETGPGFTMTLGSRTLRVTPVRSESLQVRIEPLSSFGQQVQLSCAGGLPEGHACLFSPNTLNGKGISTLKIGRMAEIGEGHSGKPPTNRLTFGLFTLVLLGSLARRSRGLLLFVILCSLGLISGCGAASSSGSSTQRLVLTIRAESGTGPDTIVHSTQVTLIMPNSK